MASPGEQCQRRGCEGRLYVYAGYVENTSGNRVRYLRCNLCKDCPPDNKSVLPPQFVFPRTKRRG